MKFQRAYERQQGIDEGIERGIEKECNATIARLRKKGYTEEQIADFFAE